MLEYGETDSNVDFSTWTPEARNRLIQFFQILIEWEAARPDPDDRTHDRENDQADPDGSRKRDCSPLRSRLLQGPGT
jgi:hypothetical protein